MRLGVPRPRSSPLAVVGSALLLAVGAGLAGPGVAGHDDADDLRRVVLELDDDASPGVVAGAGGVVVDELDGLGLVVADVPATAVEALRADPAVAHLALDREVAWQSTPDPQLPADQPNSSWEIADAVGATAYWRAGAFGRGVDVALIDTGVTPVTGLHQRGKVQHSVDLSTDGASPELEHLDAFGHGTAMAGIIAGKARHHSGGGRAFVGVAPGARVVSVKVGDATGEVDVTQVIAALDWVVQRQRTDGRNVRVVNLSFGLDGDSWSDWDPVSYATEVARRSGLVVVASAGNAGPNARKVLMPAEHDGVIAVGATDMRGTASVDDDTVAAFSQGATQDTRQADLAAPGTRIVSLRVPDSLIDVQNPHARVGEDLIRGNGTSQAAAVVSGAAALLLSRHPHLTPDQVKAYLVQTAEPVDAEDPRDGSGTIRLDRLLDLPELHHTLLMDHSEGDAALDDARGDDLAMSGAGDIAANGTPWLRERWAGSTWHGTLWQGDEWNGGPWGAALAERWDELDWNGEGWNGSRWNGREWAGSRWNGSRWNGSRWNGSRWNNRAWQSADGGARPWSTAWWG